MIEAAAAAGHAAYKKHKQNSAERQTDRDLQRELDLEAELDHLRSDREDRGIPAPNRPSSRNRRLPSWARKGLLGAAGLALALKGCDVAGSVVGDALNHGQLPGLVTEKQSQTVVTEKPLVIETKQVPVICPTITTASVKVHGEIKKTYTPIGTSWDIEDPTSHFWADPEIHGDVRGCAAANGWSATWDAGANTLNIDIKNVYADRPRQTNQGSAEANQIGESWTAKITDHIPGQDQSQFAALFNGQMESIGQEAIGAGICDPAVYQDISTGFRSMIPSLINMSLDTMHQAHIPGNATVNVHMPDLNVANDVNSIKAHGDQLIAQLTGQHFSLGSDPDVKLDTGLSDVKCPPQPMNTSTDGITPPQMAPAGN